MTTDQKRVLIVDDSSFIRTVAKNGLERTADWEVLTAASGRDALATAETAPLDVILLDVVMPDLDGPATIGALHANEATKHIPVIFLTAADRADDVKFLSTLGAEGLIPKPFDPSRLAASIRYLLGWK